MPKSLIILSFSLAIVGCASTENTRTITWERVSAERLAEICKSHSFAACAIWKNSKLDNRCNIYSVDTIEPNSRMEQFMLGHEVLHCFRGQFHPL